MRKYLLLLILAAVMLVGCNDTKEKPDETEPPAALTYPILGDGAPEYTLIRPMPTKVAIVDAASELQDAIEELTGESIYFVTDWVDPEKGEDIPENAHEILVGSTNRKLSLETAGKLGENEYAIAFDGTKLALIASDNYGVALAVDALIGQIRACGGNLSLPVGCTVTSYEPQG